MAYQLYLKRLSSILGFLLLLNLISFIVFLYNPKAFYFRAWEYFPEVAYKFAEYEPVWNQDETSDQTRDNFFYYQDPHHTFVSTDADGFRKTRITADRYDIVVTGDSAVFGTGLSDTETLPWQLSEKLDKPVFNGGRSSLFNVLKRPELRDAHLVIDMRAEREIKGAVFNSYEIPEDSPYQPQLTHDRKLYELPTIVASQRYLLTSIAFRTLQRIANDIPVFITGGEQPYLFATHAFSKNDLDAAVESILIRQQQLRTQGKDYVFIGIPAKQTLYHDNVDDFTRNYLNQLTERLRAVDVETVNLLETFVTNKSLGLYRNYDTHWNPRGVEIASLAIADYLATRGNRQIAPGETDAL